MHDLTFKELMKLSLVLPILLGMSIVCIAAAFERWVFFIRNARSSGRFFDKVRTFVKSGHYKEAKHEASRRSGFIGDAIASQIDSVHLPRTERESLILYHHQRFQALLGKRLWIFGTLSFICPLIGLWGTVMGVIRSFRDLALSGSGGPSIVAAGISEALIATAGGIGVAIVAAIIYNFFNIWMKDALASNDIFGQELILITASKSHSTHTTHTSHHS